MNECKHYYGKIGECQQLNEFYLKCQVKGCDQFITIDKADISKYKLYSDQLLLPDHMREFNKSL